MTATHICVATPAGSDTLHVGCVVGLLDLTRACDKQGLKIDHLFLSHNSLITHARNLLVARFLESEATHLLFVDSDIGYAAADAFRLLEFDGDVVLAPYPKKTEPLQFTIAFEDPSRVVMDRGFARVAHGPTGFMLIRRTVFERMMDASPERRLVPSDPREAALSKLYMHFDTERDPASGHYLSEDVAFCRRWRALGGHVWADTQAKLSHVGGRVYSGRLADLMRPVPGRAPDHG